MKGSKTRDSSEIFDRAEIQLLLNRGIRLLRKIGEGSYSKVYLAELRKKKDVEQSTKKQIPIQQSTKSDPATIKEDSLETENKDDDVLPNKEFGEDTKYMEQTEESEEEVITLAVKVIGCSKSPPSEYYTKFLPREIEILSRINHDHIIHVHTIFSHHKMVYILMRYAEHGDLLDFLIQFGVLGEGQARLWVRQLTHAVNYLHGIGIAHRDLKCENILITGNMNVKLSDFGFSRVVVVPEDKTEAQVDGNESSSSKKMSLCETYCGSLSYVAPEILRGKPYDATISDLWSLGVILYVMLNRAMPFETVNVRQLYEQQMTNKWHFRSKYESVLSDKVKKVVGGLLEPKVTQRWTIENIMNSEWFKSDTSESKKKETIITHPLEDVTSKNKDVVYSPALEEQGMIKQSNEDKIDKEADETQGVTVIRAFKGEQYESVDNTSSWKDNYERYEYSKKKKT